MGVFLTHMIFLPSLVGQVAIFWRTFAPSTKIAKYYNIEDKAYEQLDHHADADSG